MRAFVLVWITGFRVELFSRHWRAVVEALRVEPLAAGGGFEVRGVQFSRARCL